MISTWGENASGNPIRTRTKSRHPFQWHRGMIDNAIKTSTIGEITVLDMHDRWRKTRTWTSSTVEKLLQKATSVTTSVQNEQLASLEEHPNSRRGNYSAYKITTDTSGEMRHEEPCDCSLQTFYESEVSSVRRTRIQGKHNRGTCY